MAFPSCLHATGSPATTLNWCEFHLVTFHSNLDVLFSPTLSYHSWTILSPINREARRSSDSIPFPLQYTNGKSEVMNGSDSSLYSRNLSWLLCLMETRNLKGTFYLLSGQVHFPNYLLQEEGKNNSSQFNIPWGRSQGNCVQFNPVPLL